MNGSNLREIILLLVFMALITLPSTSCEDCPEPRQIGRQALQLDPEFTISVDNDSISIFGITALDADRAGNIYVLDQIGTAVHRFDSMGAYKEILIESGPGPGELENPLALAVNSDGTLYIMDPWKGGLLHFTTSGNYLGLHSRCTQSPPTNLETIDDTVVAQKTYRYVENGAPRYSVIIGVYRNGLEDSPVELYKHDYEMEFGSFGSAMRNVLLSVCYDADTHGNIYISPVSPDVYRVSGFNLDGDKVFIIEEDPIQVQREAEEISTEQLYVRGMLTSINGSDFPADYDPIARRNQVISVGSDDTGRIWVLRGTYNDPLVFDVYCLHTEELLFRAEVDDLNLSCDIIGCEYSHGYLYMYSKTPDGPVEIHVYDLASKAT